MEIYTSGFVVGFPIKNGGSFNSYVKLPEAMYHGMYNQRCDILHRCVHKDGAFLNRESNGEGLAHRTSLALCKTWQRLILSQQNMKTGRVPAGHEPHIRSCLKNEGFFTE